MQLIKVPSSEPAITALSERLITELTAGHRVLWLVPGGSGITTIVKIMETIPTPLSNLLTITLSDERYGEPGHDDSNWQQLTAAGFEGKQATLLPVLISGATLEEVTAEFESLLAQAFSTNDIIIAQLGMGSDGHVSGILPGSPATTASGLAAGYVTEQFSRVTTTFHALEQANAAFVLAFGAEKLEALNNLLQDIPLADQPAQVLKHLPEAYVYNDQLGEAL
ncbi:MAG: hypothetical protein JWO41_789 [Candidatus Saccharibacteria bacterium]|nr:hypothetical protein [Candidatus Saccharibacteria bacterium]